MLIDRYLPTFDESYICEVSVGASPSDTYDAMKETNLRDPIIDMFFELRELPRNIARRWRGEQQPAAARTMTFGDIATQGLEWLVLAEEPGVELVIGAVGRFWQSDDGVHAVTEPEFIPFSLPGYAKLAISLSVRPAGTGSILRYEARTDTTDESARRTFRRYWRVIGAGVGIVMRRAARRIKHEAERPARNCSCVV